VPRTAPEGTVLSTKRLDRLVEIFGGLRLKPQFNIWAGNYKHEACVDKTFDGAGLKFLRLRKRVSLLAAADLVGSPESYLGKIETGANPMTLLRRLEIAPAES